MLLPAKAKLVAVCSAIALGGLLTVVVFAAPDSTPTPGPSGLDATATPGATEALEPTETPEATEALDPTETPDPAETPQPTDEPDGDDNRGVPEDSPACAGDLDHPNPHDTDGDGDGCRIVETEDGMKNLPDPAADAHEGHPGDIGDQHRPPHSQTPGPPDGDPPYGNAHGHDEEDATPTPTP